MSQSRERQSSFYDEHPAIRTYASEEEKILRAMVEKVPTEPKLYVKLAAVDSQKEKQTVEIIGFENAVYRMAEKENVALAVPELTAAEEEKTSTSIGLCWTESKGASVYEMLVTATSMRWERRFPIFMMIWNIILSILIVSVQEMRKATLHGVKQS